MALPYPYPFDREKALECVLYLASRIAEPGLHNISKLLYFADKRHLDMHGRLLYGDEYVAMEVWACAEPDLRCAEGC